MVNLMSVDGEVAHETMLAFLLAEINIDCRNKFRVATFWSALLKAPLRVPLDGWFRLGPRCEPGEKGRSWPGWPADPPFTMCERLWRLADDDLGDGEGGVGG
jgi:hypothetical protein